MKKFYVILLMLLACGVQMATARGTTTLGKFLVSSIAHDDQNIYIGTKNGLIVIDKETESQTLYNSENSSLPFNTDPDMEPYKERIYSLAMHDGVLWLGRPFCSYSSFCDGAFTNYQKMIPEFEFWYNVDEIAGFPVGSLAFDPDGEQMYISELDAFAPLLNGEFLPGYCFFTSLSGSGGCIEDMQCDENGTLWIVDSDSYNGYGFCRYTKEGGLDLFLENYDDSDIPILGRNIASVCLEIGPDGHVWIGPRGYLVEYDGEAFHCYDPGILNWQNGIRDLKFDDEGILWCISRKGQLISFDGETFVSHKVAEDDDRCECIDIDGSNIYIGSSKGLIIYNNGVQRNIELQTTVTTGIDNHSAAISSSLLYDLQGRRLNGKPEKGLYIQNGRKQVVR